MSVDKVKKSSGIEGLNFWDLLEALRSAWLWLLCGGMIGLISAAIFVMVVPAQYEATAIIQPATVGLGPLVANSLSPITKGVDVESPLQTLERLKTPMFYTDDLLATCNIKPGSEPRRELATDIRPVLIKGNSLIQVSYRSESRSVAAACILGVVTQMAKVQSSLAEPLIENLKEQMNLTKQQLGESERFQTQIEKRAMTLDPSDAKFSQAMLMLNAALSKREEISKLRKLYNEQSMQLNEPLTQPTKLFEEIYAPDRVVFPKKSVSFLVGLFLGLVFGGAAFFIRRSWFTKEAV